MEGIIGRRVLVIGRFDTFFRDPNNRRTSISFPCLHVMKVTHVLYHLVHVDFYLCHCMINKKREKLHIDL